MWSTMTDIILGLALTAQYTKIIKLQRYLDAITKATSDALGQVDEQVEELINVINTNADTLADHMNTETTNTEI
jgi:hypothetical protein